MDVSVINGGGGGGGLTADSNRKTRAKERKDTFSENGHNALESKGRSSTEGLGGGKKDKDDYRRERKV